MKRIGTLSLILFAALAGLLYLVQVVTSKKADSRTLHVYVEDYALESLDHLWMTQTDRALMDLFLMPLRGESLGMTSLLENAEADEKFQIFKLRFKPGFKTPLGVELNAATYLAGVRAEARAQQSEHFTGGVFFDVVDYAEFLEKGQSAGLQLEDPRTLVIRYPEPRRSFLASLDRLNLAFRSDLNLREGQWADPHRVDGLSAWSLKNFGPREITLERNPELLPEGPYDQVQIHKRTLQEISQISDIERAVLYMNNAATLAPQFRARAGTDLTSFYLSLNCQKPVWKERSQRILLWQAYNQMRETFEPLSSTIFIPIPDLTETPKKLKFQGSGPLLFAYESSWQGSDERELISAWTRAASLLGLQVQLKKLGPRLSVEKISGQAEDFDGFITRKKFLPETTSESRSVFFCSQKMGVNWALSSYGACKDTRNFSQAENTTALLRRDWCTQSFGQSRGQFLATSDLPASAELIDARYLTKLLGGRLEK